MFNQNPNNMFENLCFPDVNSIPDAIKLAKEIDQNEYLLNGQLVAFNGPRQEVFSPVCLNQNGTVAPVRLGSYPLLGEEEALKCVDAAVKAYDNGMGFWPSASVKDRIKAVEEFTAKMKAARNEVVNLLMWETGKNHKDSQKEFDRTVEYIIDTIHALKKMERTSSLFETEQGIIGKVKRSPVGVVLCMGPFNYPLNETFTTLIPALLMGNTVIFKPAKIGVLLHYPLLKAFQECFPAGVINIIYGRGRTLATALMKSGQINALAFIGTSKSANALKMQHPKPNRLRSVLGLEAKNAGIVLNDADVDLAVKECISGSLSFNGQRCTALKILYVHKSVADEFLKKFKQEVDNIKIGMPWEDNVMITPLPEPEKPSYLQELIDDATRKGAEIINKDGGKFHNKFFIPAVLYPVTREMRVSQEEQFGPVVPIIPFESLDEPLDYIIQSDYGQQVSIFGTASDSIAFLVDRLVNQVCRVNINSQCQRGPDIFPFNGRKDSAEGTLSVNDALRAFSIRALVAAKENDINKLMLNDIIKYQKSNFLSADLMF
jgi:glyceraldehyde-3-phosphate dehydrogenase (NADP+)